MNTEYLKGLLLTSLGVLVLSFDALLIRLIQAEPFSLLFWRGLLLALMVALWCRYRYPGKPLLNRDWASIRSAAFYSICSILFVTAVHHTSVANVLVIISAQPLFAAIIARLFIGERSAPITWIAIVISMLGIGWVMKDSWSSPNLQGDLMALFCGIALAAKFVNDRAEKHRNMTPALITSGLLVSLTSLFFASPLALTGADWGWMLLLCVIVIPTAFILITLGPTRISAAEVGMLMLLETACGPLLVWLFIGEEPSLAALQGGALVIITLLIHGYIRWKK
ncbi:DMT family transporter [Amphritea pacifica]|uniref:EamA family transporter n=1 Tax=Amphritea pacifica TaxID=2811233 RepID=A0ABS2W2R6_9GAMM|nr:EamA family transporter [Amphritea pacifica]MBN0985990.1 EamA family transporter [Amphritea pacifica]MBN1006770.1 EamA family transporter [Amphritea pacifica]